MLHPRNSHNGAYFHAPDDDMNYTDDFSQNCKLTLPFKHGRRVGQKSGGRAKPTWPDSMH